MLQAILAQEPCFFIPDLSGTAPMFFIIQVGECIRRIIAGGPFCTYGLKTIDPVICGTSKYLLLLWSDQQDLRLIIALRHAIDRRYPGIRATIGIQVRDHIIPPVLPDIAKAQAVHHIIRISGIHIYSGIQDAINRGICLAVQDFIGRKGVQCFCAKISLVYIIANRTQEGFLIGGK
ncbi:hypothetical protein D3C72_1039080 [compost metagenome]